MLRKILGVIAAALAVALVVVTPQYPTWLTDHSFKRPYSDSLYWMRTGPLVCILLTLGLTFVVLWCFQERSPKEAATEVLERPTAPN